MKLLSMALLSFLCIACGMRGDKSASQYPPNNTGINLRDVQGGPLTPENQSNEEKDLKLTQHLRQAVMQDSFSTNAKNIKIITVEGKVTLRGPVNSLEEKTKIATKATQIAGSGNVDNQLEIIP